MWHEKKAQQSKRLGNFGQGVDFNPSSYQIWEPFSRSRCFIACILPYWSSRKVRFHPRCAVCIFSSLTLMYFSIFMNSRNFPLLWPKHKQTCLPVFEALYGLTWLTHSWTAVILLVGSVLHGSYQCVYLPMLPQGWLTHASGISSAGKPWVRTGDMEMN